MDSSPLQFLTVIGSQLLTQVPLLLVYVVGAVAGALSTQLSPRARGLLAGGCALLLATSLAHTLAFAYLTLQRSELGLSVRSFGLILSGVGLASAVLHAVGIGLLIGAVFAAARAATTVLPQPVDYPRGPAPF